MKWTRRSTRSSASEKGDYEVTEIKKSFSVEVKHEQSKFNASIGFLNDGAEMVGEAETHSQTVTVAEGVTLKPNKDYRRLKNTMLDDVDQLDISRLELPNIAAKYSGPAVQHGQSVLIDAEAPLGGDAGGFLRLANNTDKTLTNCTLQLTLKGNSGAKSDLSDVAHIVLLCANGNRA